ncbi:histidine phosphatase family protein [Psychrobacter sp. JCM 18900]|uniref:histidine phosphatase family protein n=1 Tax=Psychrobacter sp. JCM 18900 TaxID=1298608 RepID=UPI0004AF0FAF|nr:histidine phosphatase family protein [Psychrobacter sp. JCM 18900]
MKIILVRHGQAEDETRPDSARQLTDFGQQQAAQTAEYVNTHYSPDRFVVSLILERSRLYLRSSRERRK